ncbi:MAG TPA: hypothetical protein EYH56_02300 [Nanoarchaeota archaeon]|nr:hypothetical protein [Nanoarchaeota archaeon]
MKAVSPLISAIFLIGLAFSLGVILMSWLNEMGKEKGENVETSGEKVIQCTLAKFKIIKPLLKYNFSSEPYINITIYNIGKTELYNFSFSVITKKGNMLKSYIFAPENQKTKSQPLKPGEIWAFNIIPKNDKPSKEEELYEISITAICGEDYIVKNSIKIER